MKKVFKLILITLIGSTVFFSCSTTRKAKRLLRQADKKITKALVLAPELADTVNKARTITVTIPGKSDTIEVQAELDTMEFAKTIGLYDDLLLLEDSLLKSLENNQYLGAQRENALLQLYRVRNQLNESQSRLILGFTKDSTYIYEDDRLSLRVTTTDGVLSDIFFNVKPVEADTVVVFQKVNIDASKEKGLFYYSGVGIFLLLIIGFIGLIIMRYLKK